jgi:magnesium transporter
LLENSDPIRALHHLIIALHAPFAALVLRLDERLDAPEQRGSAPPGSATGETG